MPGDKDKKVIEIEEDYICPLSAKLISEIEEPALTPSGHIYERADLLAWIAKSGGKDPIDVAKPLTVEMLIPNFAVKEVLKKHKSDMSKMLQAMEKAQAKHDKQIGKMSDLLEGVLEQNKLLKKQAVKATWNQFGTGIDKQLTKSSTEDRKAALKAYKDQVLASADDEEFQVAVQDTAPLLKKEISSHRMLSWFRKYSSTTTVALEFENNVTKVKGW